MAPDVNFSYRVTAAAGPGAGTALVAGTGRTRSSEWRDVVSFVLAATGVSVERCGDVDPPEYRFVRDGRPVFVSISPVPDQFAKDTVGGRRDS